MDRNAILTELTRQIEDFLHAHPCDGGEGKLKYFLMLGDTQISGMASNMDSAEYANTLGNICMENRKMIGAAFIASVTVLALMEETDHRFNGHTETDFTSWFHRGVAHQLRTTFDLPEDENRGALFVGCSADGTQTALSGRLKPLLKALAAEYDRNPRLRMLVTFISRMEQKKLREGGKAEDLRTVAAAWHNTDEELPELWKHVVTDNWFDFVPHDEKHLKGILKKYPFKRWAYVADLMPLSELSQPAGNNEEKPCAEN